MFLELLDGNSKNGGAGLDNRPYLLDLRPELQDLLLEAEELVDDRWESVRGGNEAPRVGIIDGVHF